MTSSFSPPPPTKTDSVCWEANFISFNASNVLGSKNVLNAGTTFENGWAAMSFWPLASTAQAIPPLSLVHQLGGGASTYIQLLNGATNYQSSTTYAGLPVVGFAAVTFSNGSVNGVASNFGGNFNHKATRLIGGGFPVSGN